MNEKNILNYDELDKLGRAQEISRENEVNTMFISGRMILWTIGAQIFGVLRKTVQNMPQSCPI